MKPIMSQRNVETKIGQMIIHAILKRIRSRNALAVALTIKDIYIASK